MRLNDQLIDLPNLYHVIDRSPLTISPDSYVMDAIALIGQARSSSLPLTNLNSKEQPQISHQQGTNYVIVVDRTELLGIITEKDLVQTIATGRNLSSIKVTEVMRPQVVTLGESHCENICTALLLLHEHGIQHLPIVDDQGQLLGIVTEAKLLQAIDLVKMVCIVETLQHHLNKPKSALSQYIEDTKTPLPKKIERLRCQTHHHLNLWVEKHAAQMKLASEELRQTLEELQVTEEELRQQNEQLAIAREQAELERQRYQDLFEFAPDGYLVTDAAGIIQEANQAAATMVGINQNYLVGKPLVLFIAAKDRHSLMTQLHNGQEVQNWELYLQPRGGQPFPASVRVAAVYNSQGAPIGRRWLLCNISQRYAAERQRQQAEEALRRAHDELEIRVAERTAELCQANVRLQEEIRERQRAEEALRQSEQLYRDLVNRQTELVFRFDVQGQVTFANLASCQTLGLSLDELRGQSLFQFLHPDDTEQVSANINALASPPHSLNAEEKRIFTVNGVRWFEWSITAIKDLTGEIVEYQSVGRDITERQKMQAALWESETKFRYFAENINAVICICHPETSRILYISPAYEKIWGCSCQSLLDQPHSWIDRVHPEDRHLAQTKLDLKRRGESSNIEYRILLPDGSMRWIWDRGFAIRDQQGNIDCYGVIAEDITERKQAEESLSQSEERLSLALEAAHMGIWDWNLMTNEVVFSPGILEIYGLSSDSSSFHIEEFVHPIHSEDQQSLFEMISRTIKEGGEYAVEFRVIWPDGSIHWLLARGQVYYNEFGQPLRMIATTREITDRKQAQQALKESEERYRSVVLAMAEGIVLQEADGKIVTCNQSAEKILGLTADQMTGLTCEDPCWRSIHEDGSPFPGATHPASVTLQTGEPRTNVVMGIHQPNGKLIWISINSQPLFRENESTPYGVVTSFSDISDRKQAEEKIREQAALLDITTDAIFVRDLQSRIVFWNKGAERVYGWQEQEVLGKRVNQLLCKENTPQIQAAMNAVMDHGSWLGELTKVKKCGKEIIVESRWTLVRNATGQPASILTVDTDITEKKQLEAQFFRAQRLESLGTLAGGIAHDLNNILTPILASAQLLLNPKYAQEGELYRNLLGMIHSNAKRGAALVKQVLSFARGFKGEPTIVQLKHLISEITQIINQTFPKSIEVAVTIPQDLNAVYGDATQLHQVLMNLVVNARDAMPEGGTISILAKNIFIDEAYQRMNLDAKVGDYILLEVADTGIGMEPEVLERIFEPFFTTKDASIGTGLGLSTVMGIIKSHGGFLNVCTQIGRGSKFQLFLPAVEVTSKTSQQELELPRGNGELILVVDDEAQIREIATIILENNNYRTMTAANGIEAIAIYAQHKYQISAVLMDIMMPEMDGITAIQALQKMNPKVKIMASSGVNSHESLTQASGLQVQAVLSKPYTAIELLNKLHQILI